MYCSYLHDGYGREFIPMPEPEIGRSTKLMAVLIMALTFAYALRYFNYFQTPTEDFISNFRQSVLEYRSGDFSRLGHKTLPAYGMILTALSYLNPSTSGDPVYGTAIAFNIVLFIPYLLLVWLLYRRFLGDRIALFALLFHGVNIYTIYTAVNAELEMFLSFSVVLTLWLSFNRSRFSYLAAFFAAGTKWDSVFAVPAAMYNDFFVTRKRVAAILLGAAASGIVAITLLLTLGARNTYVQEISRRGPNVYRYFIDCLVNTSGYLPLMFVEWWGATSAVTKVVLMFIIIATILVIPAAVIRGAILVFKNHREERGPLGIFLLGFLLVHAVYQNTKERYVLPILWFLGLCLAYGLTAPVGVRFGKAVQRGALAIAALLLACAACVVVDGFTFANILFFVLFLVLFLALMARDPLPRGDWRFPLVIVLAVAFIGISTTYGKITMDHYSFRRVEFKKAALWFDAHAAPGDLMLINDTTISHYYYPGDDARLVPTGVLRGNTLEELIGELERMKITHVFVDDFYTRRFLVGDKNALERKAGLFIEIRDRGERTGHFKLVERFVTRGTYNSYIYRFIP